MQGFTNQARIILLRDNQGLFDILMNPAFLRCHKATGHHHAIRTKGQGRSHGVAVGNTARGYYRDVQLLR